MAGLRFADLQSRPTEFLDFSSWSRPSRRRSTRIWRRGASMGNPGPPAGLPSIRTVPCQTPPYLVVKLQPLDIIDVILRMILRLRVVYPREIKG